MFLCKVELLSSMNLLLELSCMLSPTLWFDYSLNSVVTVLQYFLEIKIGMVIAVPPPICGVISAGSSFFLADRFFKFLLFIFSFMGFLQLVKTATQNELYLLWFNVIGK